VKKDIPAERPPKKRELVIPKVCAMRNGRGVSVGIVIVFLRKEFLWMVQLRVCKF